MKGANVFVIISWFVDGNFEYQKSFGHSSLMEGDSLEIKYVANVQYKDDRILIALAPDI